MSVWAKAHDFVFGRRVRAEACRCAAIAMAARKDNEVLVPLAWSFAVFFEMYILSGAKGTREEFGPHEPVELKQVKP